MSLAPATDAMPGFRRTLVLDVTLGGTPLPWQRLNPRTETNAPRYHRRLCQIADVLAANWRRRARRDPLNEPLAAEMVFRLARPQRRPPQVPPALWALPDCPALGAVDLDNLVAAILDAGGSERSYQAGIWSDDQRFVEIDARKVWLAPGEPRTRERSEIRVYRLEPIG